jgi:membrane protein
MFLLTIGRTFWAAIVAWWNDDAMRLGASVAYYSLFAIAPVLLIAVAVAGTIFGAEAVRGQLSTQIDGLVGPQAAEAVEALLKGSAKPASNTLAVVAGLVTMVLAACGAFLEMRWALNTIWRVPPSPIGALKAFWFTRLRAFGLVLAIGFLLLVSLVVSAALAALHEWLSAFGLLWPFLLQALTFLLTLIVSATLFGLMFKVLPDVPLSYRDVAVGALVTAILFAAGKYLIGLYLGRTAASSSYGAAGSVVILLLWVYYSAQIVLIGAEFTRLYAERDSVPPRQARYSGTR